MRVETGQKINIWTDPWIPSSPSRMIETPKGQLLIKTVDELILQDTMQWDEQFLR